MYLRSQPRIQARGGVDLALGVRDCVNQLRNALRCFTDREAFSLTRATIRSNCCIRAATGLTTVLASVMSCAQGKLLNLRSDAPSVEFFNDSGVPKLKESIVPTRYEQSAR